MPAAAIHSSRAATGQAIFPGGMAMVWPAPSCSVLLCRIVIFIPSGVSSMLRATKFGHWTLVHVGRKIFSSRSAGTLWRNVLPTARLVAETVFAVDPSAAHHHWCEPDDFHM